METVHRGKVWKFGDRISTDFMMPGSRVLANPNMTLEEKAACCMEANRPGWATNAVQPGDIVVGGINFGCGSSRNGSEPLKALGVAVVLADSIARIHLRNAVNTGLPTLVAPGISSFVQEGERLEVDITSGVVKNLDQGTTMQAQPWEQGTPPYEILMAGGLDAYAVTEATSTIHMCTISGSSFPVYPVRGTRVTRRVFPGGMMGCER